MKFIGVDHVAVGLVRHWNNGKPSIFALSSLSCQNSKRGARAPLTPCLKAGACAAISVSRFTPVYMALIDPFRKLVVYPLLLRSVRAKWNNAFDLA
jgi:hypothetical protein